MDFATLLRSLPGGAAQGLTWGILGIAVFITYKILDFADLTVDGSLATGGAVAAVSVVAGIHPLLAMLFAFLAGAAAGAITALLNTKLKIPAILSGILTMTALYSINIPILRSARGSTYVDIPPRSGIFGKFATLVGLSPIDDINVSCIIVTAIIVIVLIAALYWFFGTEIGSAVRATGSNEKMARAQGINTDSAKFVALSLSNGLAALAGAVIAQNDGQASLDMAQGTIVIGLASVIIGELIIGEKKTFWLKLLGVIIGSVVYRLIFVIATCVGLDSGYLKLVSSVIVVITLCIPNLKNRFAKRSKKNVRT